MIDWHTFVKVNEEHISDITNIIYEYLPPRIQAFVYQVTSDYCADTLFGIPDQDILDCQMVKRDIVWGLVKLPFPPSANNSIHQNATKSKPPKADRLGPG